MHSMTQVQPPPVSNAADVVAEKFVKSHEKTAKTKAKVEQQQPQTRRTQPATSDGHAASGQDSGALLDKLG